MSYWTRLWDALRGSEPAPVAVAVAVAAPAPEPPASDTTDWEARMAALEMDVRERDQRIAAMQKEYASLQTEGKRAEAGAGQEQLEQVFRKMAPALASLTTLAGIAESGQAVESGDFAGLVRSLERQLKAAGLERVGTAGEEARFDAAIHQRMSGGGVSAGGPVSVRLPGYRFAGKVLLKAMVSAPETRDE